MTGYVLINQRLTGNVVISVIKFLQMGAQSRSQVYPCYLSRLIVICLYLELTTLGRLLRQKHKTAPVSTRRCS